ncbi:hypothetical protein [uncultured Clostridium sp.]|uniref:hypothetical protein n=1 Tax=uncultured Clostridium sp. TaxID=59620 RepID=UPI00260F7F99|nr:hypothetical protein [uncultured Clostridium sp.]
MGQIEIISANHLDGIEDKIDAFIFSVSGIHLKEQTEGDKFSVSFGKRDGSQLEVGFYKSRHPEIKDFRYSCYLSILQEFSGFVQATAEFEIFCYSNKLKDHEKESQYSIQTPSSHSEEE